MNERLVFVILLGVISVLWYIVGYWRRKAGETAFLAAQKTEKEDERDRLCRWREEPVIGMLVVCSVVYIRIYSKNSHHSNHSNCTVQK